MTLELYDRMKWLAEYEVPKKVYKKDKSHRQGWTTKQIIQDIARRSSIPVGQISAQFGTVKHSRFETTGSVLDSLHKILKAHKTKVAANVKKNSNGKRKVAKTRSIIHTRDGKLNILTILDPAKNAAN